jgi:predicted RNase H-like nuclease (RuvC/YqgF family)
MGGGRLSPDEQRQLEREYRARRLDAEALRRELQQSGADVESLQEWIARLQDLERGRSFDDPEELARLHAAVVEGMKAYEFALRRALESGDDRPLLDARGEVPPGFKALVEEYYKSLARPR